MANLTKFSDNYYEEFRNSLRSPLMGQISATIFLGISSIMVYEFGNHLMDRNSLIFGNNQQYPESVLEQLENGYTHNWGNTVEKFYQEKLERDEIIEALENGLEIRIKSHKKHCLNDDAPYNQHNCQNLKRDIKTYNQIQKQHSQDDKIPITYNGVTLHSSPEDAIREYLELYRS